MANEITTTIGIKIAKDNAASVDRQAKQATDDWTGDKIFKDTVSVATSYAALSFGGLTTYGFAYFKNLDATNYVEIGLEVASTFYPFAKLEPGQRALVPLATGSIFAQANTAAVLLEFEAAER